MQAQAQAQKKKKNIKKREDTKTTEKNAEAERTLGNKKDIEMKKIIEMNKGNLREIYTGMTKFLLEEDLKKNEESGNIKRNKDGSYSIKGNIYKKYSKKDIINNLLTDNKKRYDKQIMNYIRLVNFQKKKQENNQEISLLQSKIEKQKEILKEFKKKSDDAERFVKKIEFNRRLASIERNAEDEIAESKRELKSMFNDMDIENDRNISKLRRETDTKIRENRLKDEKKWIENLHKGFLEYKQQKDERTEEKRKEREEIDKAKQKEREEREREREKDMKDFNREMREREEERDREREMERQREREEFEIRKAEIEKDAERQRRIFDEQERERMEQNRRRLERSSERIKNAQMERNKFLSEQEGMRNKFASELEEIRKDRVKLEDGSEIIINPVGNSYTIEIKAKNNLNITGRATDIFNLDNWLSSEGMSRIYKGENKKTVHVCPAGQGGVRDTYTFRYDNGNTETYEITFNFGGEPNIRKIQ